MLFFGKLVKSASIADGAWLAKAQGSANKLTLTIRACALAKNSDFSRITSERVNVALDPVKSKALIKKTEITFGQRKFWSGWKTED